MAEKAVQLGAPDAEGARRLRAVAAALAAEPADAITDEPLAALVAAAASAAA